VSDEFGELFDFDLEAAMTLLNIKMEKIAAEFQVNMELISDDKFWLGLKFDFDINAPAIAGVASRPGHRRPDRGGQGAGADAESSARIGARPAAVKIVF
jgi:hypothetical protein